MTCAVHSLLLFKKHILWCTHQTYLILTFDAGSCRSKTERGATSAWNKIWWNQKKFVDKNQMSVYRTFLKNVEKFFLCKTPEICCFFFLLRINKSLRIFHVLKKKRDQKFLTSVVNFEKIGPRKWNFAWIFGLCFRFPIPYTLGEEY